MLVGRPAPGLLDGRQAVPGPALWHVLPRGGWPPERGAPPVLSGAPRSARWLPEEDRGPWTAELRRLARERDLERARLLEQAGRPEPARRLREAWGDQSSF